MIMTSDGRAVSRACENEKRTKSCLTSAPGIMILGATGSVGSQAADVAQKRGYDVRAVSANRNSKAVEDLCRLFRPEAAAMADEGAAADLKVRVADIGTKVYSGSDGLTEMIRSVSADTVVNAVSGAAGLAPTLAAMGSGMRLALANKESLVIAGDAVMSEARRTGTEIIPVDSEHSAIFQCLKSGGDGEARELILTASGGPFFGMKRAELGSITPERALDHPVWKMGAEITVDSATLMNKGFEVIEASKLFGMPGGSISVLVHRQGVVHSLVRFADNSYIAQMSKPDMRLCVEYAVDYPHRTFPVIDRLDLTSVGPITFEKPDTETFVPLSLAYHALKAGGALPAVLHAANSAAVSAFLKKNIGFTGIFDILEKTVARFTDSASCSELPDILSAAAEAERYAASLAAGK